MASPNIHQVVKHATHAHRGSYSQNTFVCICIGLLVESSLNSQENHSVERSILQHLCPCAWKQTMQLLISTTRSNTTDTNIPLSSNVQFLDTGWDVRFILRPGWPVGITVTLLMYTTVHCMPDCSVALLNHNWYQNHWGIGPCTACGYTRYINK